MGVLKSVFSESDFDSRVYQIIKDIIGENNFKEFKDFLYFYRITAEVEKDFLKIKQFSHKEGRWIEIAIFNLKTKKVEKSIDKNEFLKVLQEENNYILSSTEKEIKRVANIVLALLSLIIGALVSLLVINVIK
ncbi:hypothetical protein SAMN06265182_1008 [Persephonella hydrogeniphila]|uniref:Uncharacterized protein n=1 Tax=Persephonella hydrogeniphila TaxID=198703 RepID=A0A285NIT9_9AQUI|nr:hypothetical protein [Persephonella hydrogeniphila]SNZ07766.1 hypothetical protein SAMN06265182_1008 [Persephonella hydrogeniphila]